MRAITSILSLLVLLLFIPLAYADTVIHVIHMEITWYGRGTVSVSELELCMPTKNTIITIYGDTGTGGDPTPPFGIYERKWNGHDWFPTRLIADLTPYTTGWTGRCCIQYTAHTSVNLTIRDGYIYFKDKQLCPAKKWNPKPLYSPEYMKYEWYNTTIQNITINLTQNNTQTPKLGLGLGILILLGFSLLALRHGV